MKYLVVAISVDLLPCTVYLEIVGYLICMTMLRARFVNLRNLQTALRNLGIVHVQLINF